MWGNLVNRAGKRKYILPIGIIIVLGLWMSVMFYPMANMSLSDIPFGIASLDKGATVSAAALSGNASAAQAAGGDAAAAAQAAGGDAAAAAQAAGGNADAAAAAQAAGGDAAAAAQAQTSMNMGDTIVDQMIESTKDSDDSMIEWNKLKDQKAVDEALDNNDYFGVMVIPEDYTESQMAAQSGKGKVSPIKVYIDYAKSPMVATQLQNNMASMFEQQGMDVDVEVVNNGGGNVVSNGSPYSGMMSQQLTAMPIYMMSFMSAMLIRNIFKKRREDPLGQRSKAVIGQIVGSLVCSLLIGLAVVGIVTWVGGVNMPFMNGWLFLSLGSFGILMLFVGLFDISNILGGIGMAILMPFGMMTAAFPPELMPKFWQNCICPWVPQRWVGEGVRQILYMGDNAWTKGSLVLLIYVLVGIALALVSIAIKGKKKDKKAVEGAAEGTEKIEEADKIEGSGQVAEEG